MDPKANGENRDREAQRAVGGRPTKLTPELQEKFLEAIRTGNHREVAAAWAGISPATLYRWLSSPDEPFRSFREALLVAEASVEMGVVASITNQIPKNPKLGLEFLSRRYPQRWAPVKAHAVDHRTEAPDGRPSNRRHIDRDVEAGYERLTVADRWAKSMLAMATDNDEELTRLRETCPPEDHAAMDLWLLRTEWVVARAATVWYRAITDLAMQNTTAFGRRLGLEMYELGLSDARSEPLPGQGYRERFLGRVGPIGERFAHPSYFDTRSSAKRLRSLWQGIREFSERIGIKDAEVLLAVQPSLYESIQGVLAKFHDDELDQDVVRETADGLWHLWESR